MIHFSHIVEDAGVEILTESNQEIDSFNIKNQEFVNHYLPLEKGSYQIKITERDKEINIKSIIIN
jgi:hypothetical protein